MNELPVYFEPVIRCAIKKKRVNLTKIEFKISLNLLRKIVIVSFIKEICCNNNN